MSTHDEPFGDLDVPMPQVPDRGPDVPYQHAEVRPGPHAPIPPSRGPLPNPYAGASTSQLIGAAHHLRRTAYHWESDPAWPPLRDQLEIAYAAMLDDTTNSARWLRMQIAGLLGIKAEPTDTQRLDALLAYINRGQTAQLWDRATIDRLMERPQS